MTDRPDAVVFIRCHKFNLKSAHLFRELEGGVGYDLFFMTDDTNGAGEYGGVPRVSFTSAALKEFGVDPLYKEAVVHYGDLMFSIFRRAQPEYSHYIMLDYDIYFSYLGRAWMESFCHQLRTSEPLIDMVAPQIGPAPVDWVWQAAAATRFAEVFGSFFPIVALSQRAIFCNERERVTEAATRGPNEEPVFCEAFLPSALNEYGYNLVELNVFLPGSFSLSSFNFTLPSPFRPSKDCEIGRVIHPIKAMIDAPLPPASVACVLEVEPDRGLPISTGAAFDAAAALVRDQAACRGLQRNLGPKPVLTGPS